MDRADLRVKLIETFDDIAGRTWVVPAELRRIARASRRCTEERDDWVDVLLEFVNKTYEPPPEDETLPGHKPTLSRMATEITQALGAVGYHFSPMIIIAIIGVLISLYRACKLSPAQARKRASRPRFLDRAILRRTIREQGRYQPQDHEVIEGAILDAGQVLTTGEMTALYAETE